MAAKPQPAIVGYGSSRYEKRPTKGLLDHLWESVEAALENARVKHSDVDGLAVSSFGLAPGNVVTLAEHFGMQLNWAHQGVFGGASGVIMVGRAADAIRERQARTVVVIAGDTYTVASHNKLIDGFTPSIQKYLAPHGFGGANGIFALVQSRHTEAYGTKREQLGQLAVTQRKHAQLNENALLRDDLTLEDYLNARLIAEPLRLYDCVMPCAGSEAVVLVDEARYDGGKTPLRLLAQREVHNPYPDTPAPIRAGWELYADELFEAAGVTRDDIDFVQLYDDYPIMEAIQLEGLGFCGPGEAGPFLEDTDISLRGTLPINTGGGQLSAGQSGAGGGMIGVTEAVRQLQHEGGERQVPGAATGLVAGFGLVSYAKGLCASAMILQRPT
jgi:acetyl-CoA acetyltransferase